MTTHGEASLCYLTEMQLVMYYRAGELPAKRVSAKQAVVDIVHDMPEDSSYDEILQELLMNRMIEWGLADVEAGRTITDEEMAKTIESWRD